MQARILAWIGLWLFCAASVWAQPITSCGMAGSQEVYTGCGFTYQSRDNRDQQCLNAASWGTSQFIYTDETRSSCGIARGQEVYTGCGFTYQRRTDRDTQCPSGAQSGGSSRFIPAEGLSSSQPAQGQPPIHVPAQALPTDLETQCFGMVQGRVPWNRNGDTRWADVNVWTVCRGTQNPAVTVNCFQSVMAVHGDWNRAASACRP